jgi:effector-binding domain-containing protein
MDASQEFTAEIRELAAQPTVCVRTQAPTSSLSDIFSRFPGAVVARIQEGGAEVAGSLYARYHAFSPETVDVEVGIPVGAPIAGLPAIGDVAAGEVGAGELPAGQIAFTVHRGSYDGLSATYDRLHEWIQAAGLSEGAAPWEAYVDDPGDMSDMTNVRTEVSWPLEA